MPDRTVLRLRYEALPPGTPPHSTRLAMVEAALDASRDEIDRLREALARGEDREADLKEEIRSLRDKHWWLLYENAALQRHRPPVRMPLLRRAWHWLARR